jgi:hypothetical protein
MPYIVDGDIALSQPPSGPVATEIQGFADWARAQGYARLHDLRHRFAVTTLVRWYRAGADPEPRLPILSAYLGHVHVGDTFWYSVPGPS